MKKQSPPLTTTQLAELRRIWPSGATDKQVCAWFDRDRTTLARIARQKLGLPSTRVSARAAAFEAARDSYREAEQ